MGQTFRYIADETLGSAGRDDECPVCEKEKRIYVFYGEAKFPDGETAYIDEACTQCIQQAEFSFSEEKSRRGQIQALINRHFPKGTLSGDERSARLERIVTEHQRTPRLPHFVEDDDWPHCCGDYAEYIGEPRSEAAGDLDDFAYWEGGVRDNPAGDRIYDVIPSNQLAVLGGASGFRCSNCGKRYWTFQST